jgi:hypothetical protein
MAFILIWAVLFAQVFWVCETDTVWKVDVLCSIQASMHPLNPSSHQQTLAPQCVLGQNVAIAQLISKLLFLHKQSYSSEVTCSFLFFLSFFFTADIMADSVLIAAPLQLLWNVQITNAHRYRLMAVFSSTIVTTASSLAHAYYVLKVGGLEEVMAAIVENGLSLIVCNLAVLVAAIARLTGYGLDHGGDSYNSRGRSQGSYPLSHVTIGSMPTRKQKPTATAVNIGFEDTLSGDHDTNKMHIVDVPDQDDAPWTQAPNKGTSFWDGGRGVQITQEQYVSR